PMAALSRTSSLWVRIPSTPFSAASFSASTSVAQTVAPSRANARAVDAPIPWPAAVTTQTLSFNRMNVSPIALPIGLFDHPFLLVELLRPGMQRDAEALRRRLELDRPALGVAGIEQLARAGIPQRRGDAVDELVRLLARGRPDGGGQI